MIKNQRQTNLLTLLEHRNIKENVETGDQNAT